MTRRVKVIPKRFEDGNRASIGDAYVEAACRALDQALLKDANLFLPRFTVEQVTPMLFYDEGVAKLRAVRGLTAYSADSASYKFTTVAEILLKFSDMPAPHPSLFRTHIERAGELRDAFETANALVVKWSAVKHMLRWFNRNATAGAIRALWPSILQLCPDSPAIRDMSKTPTRYTNPQGLSGLLPLVRATASIVASMALLPESAEARSHSGVRFQFRQHTTAIDGIDVEVSPTIINL